MSTISLTSVQHSLNSLGVQLILNGTIIDSICDVLDFKIECDGHQTIGQTIILWTTFPNGTWSLTIQTECLCNERILIYAKCAEEAYQYLQTIPPIPCCCPTLELTKIKIGRCVNGIQQVSFDYIITPSTNPRCPDIVGTLNISSFGNFLGLSIPIGPLMNNVSGLSLPAGHTYTVTLTLATPSDCPPINVDLIIPACDDCCPQLDLQTNIGECDANGNRPVIFTYTITPSLNTNCPLINATLVIPNTPNILISLSSSSPYTNSITVLCQPGVYTASLIVNTPINCAGKTINFIISPSCPTAIVKRKVRDCDADYDKRHMLVKADITSPCGDTISAELEVDGQIIASDFGPSPLTLEGEADFECSHQPVLVKVTGCPNIPEEICVPDCESVWCSIKRGLLLTALGSAVILWMLFAVHAAISGVLFWVIPVKNILLWKAVIMSIFALILLFTWLPCIKNCWKCKLLLILWQLILVILCGLFFLIKGFFEYLVLAYSVSGFWLYLLLILILVVVIVLFIIIVILLFNFWKSICCPQKCTRLEELYLAFVIGFGSALVAALNITEIWQDFRWQPIAWAVGLFILLFYLIYVHNCNNPDEWE
ncbi:MAG: hypothetical protein HOO91_21640 [Bacteroidales bacterium]|nr:hypothetical protein [Bacteroidales bacterium]